LRRRARRLRQWCSSACRRGPRSCYRDQFPGDARDVETHASITEHRKQVKEDTAKAEAGEGQHLDVRGREP
jgi:hypothetical protein